MREIRRSLHQSSRPTRLSIGFAVLVLGASAALAEGGSIAIELNKLESQGQECRAYFVIDNKDSNTYEALKLDLVLFGPDGIISQRFAVDLAPLKANKRTVKLFDIAGTSCDQVGSFLVNDAMECRTEAGEVADCLQDIALSSRTDNQLTK